MEAERIGQTMTEEERELLFNTNELTRVNTQNINRLIGLSEAFFEAKKSNDEGFISLHKKTTETISNMTVTISTLHERILRLEKKRFLGIF